MFPGKRPRPSIDYPVNTCHMNTSATTADRGPSQRLLGDKVYEDLLQLLGTPGFEARARLPGETALSQRLGVSRPVLRQALARLRDEGRVYARKGSGTFVTDALPQARPMSIGTLENIADIRAFLEFRLFMEGEAAARAALTRTTDQMHHVR